MGRAHNKLVNRLEDGVAALGGECQRIDPRGHVGRCDTFVVFHRGPTHVFYFVEVKTDDDTVKPWQAREHERLRERGFDARVLQGEPEVDAFLAMLRKRLGR